MQASQNESEEQSGIFYGSKTSWQMFGESTKVLPIRGLEDYSIEAYDILIEGTEVLIWKEKELKLKMISILYMYSNN